MVSLQQKCELRLATRLTVKKILPARKQTFSTVAQKRIRCLVISTAFSQPLDQQWRCHAQTATADRSNFILHRVGGPILHRGRANNGIFAKAWNNKKFVRKQHVVHVKIKADAVRNFNVRNAARVPFGKPYQSCACGPMHEAFLNRLLGRGEYKTDSSQRRTVMSRTKYKCAFRQASQQIIKVLW